MTRGHCGSSWCFAAFAVLGATIACPAIHAKDSASFVKEAEQYVAKGNLKAAEIELRNGIRESPQDAILHARLADVYLRLGDVAAAEREARSALERNGNEADYLLVLTDALLRQEKFANLLDLVSPGERTPTLESNVRTALGSAMAGLRDKDKAEELLRQAVQLDPSAIRPKIQLARLLIGDKPEEADKFIDEAIAANPRSAEALQVRGEMLRSRGDQTGAIRLFDEALKIDPKNTLAHLSRANASITLGQYGAADEDLNPILKAAPNNFIANYLRGLELAKKQDYAGADRIFDRISSGFSVFWAGYYLQGATKFALGQYAQAQNILAKYLDRVPDDLKAGRLIAAAALKQNFPSRAIEYLRPIVDRVAADAATLTVLGNAYMADGKPDLALQQFEKGAALDPDNPAIKTRVGISEIEIGRGQQGLTTLEQVFATESGAPVAGPTLVLSELRTKHTDKAAEAANSLLKRDAQNPLYLTLLGIVRVAQQNHPAAENSFRAALAIKPEFPAAARGLAQLYEVTGRVDDAKKVYTDLLAKKSDDVGALLGLADMYISEKKWPEAVDTINRARSAAKNDPAPGLKLIGLYEWRQDWTSAKSVAAELAMQFPGDAYVLEAEGGALLGAGDVNGAASSYKRAYELAPKSEPILTRYLSLLNANKYYVEARGVLQDAIARDPGNTSLKADLVRVESETNGVDAALAMAQAFANNDPESNVYYRISAELYQKSGRTNDAIAMLDKAVAARPSDDALIILLADLCLRTADFGKAEDVLKSRLEADPKDTAIEVALGSFYLTTGRTADARKTYSELNSQRPNDAASLLGLADVAAKEKDWSQALDYLKRARAAAPNSPAPGIALVNLYGSQQDWKNATASAAELVEQFPTGPEALDAKGRVQLASGDTEGGVATYKRLYEIAPNSMPALARYLALLTSTKHFSEARSVLEAALDRDPQNGQLKGDLIRVEAEINGLEAGLAKARVLAEKDPGNPVYDMVSAELLEKAGRGGEAVGLLEKAVAARPSEDELIAALSRLHARSGEPGKAEDVLNTRLQIEPNDLLIRSTLASLYLQQKKYDDAITEYTGITAEHPGDAPALNNLAWLYQQKGDLAKARGLAERATAASPRVPQIEDTLAWILLAQGEADRALRYLSAASLSAPSNPDIQYHLAVALHRVGRQADAQAALENLLRSGVSFPDKTAAETLLQELKRG